MLLGVNVDHVATLREARLGIEPDPVMAATLAILGGADGITVHLREDRRHINDRDLYLLREVVSVELNLEMAATDEMTSIAFDIDPNMVTIVPEKRAELTTEGGLNLKPERARLKKTINILKKKDIPVSLFINPDKADIKASLEIGADMVEIHTGLYANSTGKERERELKRIKDSVDYAVKNKLLVNAGHGLNYFNVVPISKIDGIRGLYIGHSIVSRAVLVGMERAVREMKDILKR